MVKVQTAGRSGWGTLIALVMLAALVALSVSACGDDSSTASSSPSPAVSASPNSGAAESGLLLWKFKTGGRVATSPAVADGAVFVGSSDGYLYAVDAQSGEERWKVLTGDPSGSSPVVAGGLVCVASREGLIYALDRQSGEERWTFKVGETAGHARSLAASAGTVYVGRNDGGLCALDGRNGRTIWTVKDVGAEAPAASGRMVYVGTGRGLEAYDAATGKKLWTYRPWRQGVYADLVVSEGMVYGRTGGMIQAVWAVDAQTGRGGWSLPSDWPASTPPAVLDGVVYFTGGSGPEDDRRLRAVDARSGGDVWADTEIAWPDSALAASDGVLCIVAGKTVYALDAGKGDVRWTFETGEWVTTAPAVADGIAYFGCDEGYLYAVGPRPAVAYDEAPEAGAFRHMIRAGGTGTVGWSFEPSVDIVVTHLGCFSPESGGLEGSHRVGIFDAKDQRLLGAVTVRRASPLEGYFRWVPLRRPLALEAGRTYLIGTHTPGDETLYEEDLPTERWAPEVVFGELLTSYGRSGGRFMAPTDPTRGANMDKIVWMSPNFKFVPVAAASPSP